MAHLIYPAPMPQVREVPTNEVPKPLRPPIDKRKREYEQYVRQLDPKGEKAMAFDLAGDEKPRQVMTRLRLAAKRVDIPIDTWEVDGTVYAIRTDTPAK